MSSHKPAAAMTSGATTSSSCTRMVSICSPVTVSIHMFMHGQAELVLTDLHCSKSILLEREYVAAYRHEKDVLLALTKLYTQTCMLLE